MQSYQVQALQSPLDTLFTLLLSPMIAFQNKVRPFVPLILTTLSSCVSLRIQRLVLSCLDLNKSQLVGTVKDVSVDFTDELESFGFSMVTPFIVRIMLLHRAST